MYAAVSSGHHDARAVISLKQSQRYRGSSNWFGFNLTLYFLMITLKLKIGHRLPKTWLLMHHNESPVWSAYHAAYSLP